MGLAGMESNILVAMATVYCTQAAHARSALEGPDCLMLLLLLLLLAHRRERGIRAFFNLELYGLVVSYVPGEVSLPLYSCPL